MRSLLTILLISSLSPLALAEEVIHSFHADITVNADGSMDVIETIEVTAEGNKIKRGIFRDFPTSKTTILGLRKNYPFKVTAVKRDNEPDGHHLETHQGLMMNFTRVYIGHKNVKLPKGRYTYQLSYHTDGWLFSDSRKRQDELYWNITGNFWDFPIKKASATIHLPRAYPDHKVTVNGWTGAKGKKDQDWKLLSKEKGVIKVEATTVLLSQEGMTVAIFWPSGDVDLTSSQLTWQDNITSVFALFGLLGTFGVLWIGWSLVGKDPEERATETTSDPPHGLSPASARQLTRMRYDNECLSAALISAGAKGAISIHEDEKFLGHTYTLKNEDLFQYDRLSAEERILVHNLLKGQEEIELKQSNHVRIQSAIKKFRDYLKESLEGRCYKKNGKWVWMGLLTAIVFHALAVITSVKPAVGGFITVWLTFWSCLLAGLLWGVFAAWKAALNSGNALWILGAIGITLFATLFCSAEGVGLFFLAMNTSVYVAISLPLYIGMIIAFTRWMKAPTLEGRELLDQLEGYKRWLTEYLPQQVNETADNDEAKQLLDEHLPWITALDLGGTWGDKLANALGMASADDQSSHWNRHPHWYHGNHWRGIHNVGSFTNSISSGMSSAMSTSSSSSSSGSSGGGGGSSGGGGGGGGGGGW
jgi:uncharacterized membrane protein YgcG